MENTNILNVSPLGFPWGTQDPFIFCAHHRDEYPNGNERMGPDTSLEGRNLRQDFILRDGWRMYHGESVPGFPCHPHRGFETITIVKEGVVDHADSSGASGRYGSGDVQWLTAGKGIQHSEMFPLIHRDKQNPLELFQIWLNLPKVSKFSNPHFKMIWRDDIPVLKEKDSKARLAEVNIIAGSLKNMESADPTPDSWAANPNNEVLILTIKLEAKAEWLLPKANSEVNRSLYFYRGNSMEIDGELISANHSIEVRADKNIMLKANDDDCYILVLQGRAIDEPMVQYGPFVMNSDSEIADAYRDYKKTHFGGWPWSNYDQVHDRKESRFAKYTDGTKEIKN